MVKRFLDIFVSFLGLLLTSPLILVLAVWIKLDSKGPVFYKGERVGKGGKIFKMFKFRSMVEKADQIGGPSTAGDDPRLTGPGRFMKKFQLDEIPQLINVLKGEMSLVGPRPEVKMYVDMMTEEERNIIFSLKPGMTDLASLWNFHEGEVLKGSPDPEKTYQEKIRPQKIKLQLEYVKNRSFLLDLKIIFKTILKVFYG
jgi:lipopolysaccharide/colanic/teichoic acid biosynthesis glycosyltransferase